MNNPIIGLFVERALKQLKAKPGEYSVQSIVLSATGEYHQGDNECLIVYRQFVKAADFTTASLSLVSNSAAQTLTPDMSESTADGTQFNCVLNTVTTHFGDVEVSCTEKNFSVLALKIKAL